MADKNVNFNINVNTDDLKLLEKQIEDISKELEDLNKQEVKNNDLINQKLQEQVALFEKINKEKNKPSELVQVNKDIALINKELAKLNEAEVKDVDLINQKLQEQVVLLNKKKDLEDAKEAEKIAKQKAKEVEQHNRVEESLERQVQRSEKLFKVSEGAVGLFQIAEGANVLLGEKTSEELQKSIAKFQALQALTDGLKKSVEGLQNGYKLASEAVGGIKNSFKAASEGSKLFGVVTRSALIATGIGALIVALGLAIVYFEDLKKIANDIGEATGISKIVTRFKEMFDYFGGIKGQLTITKAAFEDFFNNIANVAVAIGKTFAFVGKAIYNGITGNFDQIATDMDELSATFERIGNEAGTKLREGMEKARFDKLFQDYIKEQEKYIEKLQFGVDKQKALGEDTLENELKILKKEQELNNFRRLDKELTEDEIAEINKKAKELYIKELETLKKIEDRNFNDKLKKIQKNKNIEQKIITEALDNELITEEEFNNKKFLIDEKALVDEISLRKKHGDDVTALELQLAQLRLGENKRLNDLKTKQQEDFYKEDLDALELFYKQQQLIIEQQLANNIITEDEFNKKSLSLQINYLNSKLALIKEGTAEYIAVQSELAQLQIQQNKELSDRLLEIDTYTYERKKQLLEKTKNDTTKSYKERIDASKELLANELDRLNQLQEQEQVGTLEWQKLEDQKADITNATNEEIEKAQLERIDKVAGAAKEQLANIQTVVGLLDQISKNRIDAINKEIEAEEKKFEKLDELYSQQAERVEEYNSKIEESNSRLAESDGVNFEAEKLRGEYLQQQKNIELEKQKELDAQRIESEKVKADLAKKALEEERKIKKRQQALSIAATIISTAEAVAKALTTGTPPLSFIQAGITGALGAVQVATIASQKFEKGGLLNGPSHAEGGIKVPGTSIELEGQEFVMNKRATAKFLPVLEQMNKYEEGGQLPNFNTIQSTSTGTQAFTIDLKDKIYVSVEEINTVQNRVATYVAESRI